ncbi:MAG: SprT-like domain-containing protein [Clostridiales bacterium]|nr:SprT-like domain-containing protein [Clostridiales bacterium]
MQHYINSLRDVQESLEREYNFCCPVHLDIVISKRLRSANGTFNIKIDFMKIIESAKITMSYALLEEFGWEQFEKTFRHEMAHLANYIIYKGKTHDLNFKILCQKFGGTMNSRLAVNSFSDCSTNKFVEAKKNWKYTCPCGYSRKTTKRMSVKKRTLNTHVCGSCCVCYTSKWQEQKIA